MKKIFQCILFILIAELAGIIGSFFTISAISEWYSVLIKPALNPPSFVFGPVWTVLYALMGIAAFMIWRQGTEKQPVRRGLRIFGIQLVLNAAWSILFFGMHNPGLALIDIFVLWIMILVTIKAFYKISKPASYLLFPYLAWVTFATYLNFSIWCLN